MGGFWLAAHPSTPNPSLTHPRPRSYHAAVGLAQVLVFGLASLLGGGAGIGAGKGPEGASSPSLAREQASPGAGTPQGERSPPGSASFLRLGGGGLLSALSGRSEEAGAGAATLALVPRTLQLPVLGESLVSRVVCGPRHTVVLTRPSALPPRPGNGNPSPSRPPAASMRLPLVPAPRRRDADGVRGGAGAAVSRRALSRRGQAVTPCTRPCRPLAAGTGGSSRLRSRVRGAARRCVHRASRGHAQGAGQGGAGRPAAAAQRG